MSDEPEIDDETEDSDWESGPFCIHWDDPGDCNDLCKCGHTCTQHGGGHWSCEVCDCQKFEDQE